MTARAPETLRSHGVAAVQAAMQKVRRVKYDRRGPQAILAASYGQEFELVTPPDNTVSNGVAVVMIMGPLTHRGGGWWDCGDTYDGIESRVKAAVESSAGTIVLKIDSPGGDVDGCFECSKTLRKMVAAAGKRLISYVDETAASGAYALACAASSIYMPPSARVGSIGVIQMVEDATGADAQQGYKYNAFTSGARKADGCPHLPMSPEAAAEFQRQVDAWALQFATLVADSRKVAVAEIQRLEAGIFQGADALRVRLADGVMNWDELLAMLASGQLVSAPTATMPDGGIAGDNDMKRSELIAALKAALAEEEPAPAPDKEEGDGGGEMSKADLVSALKAALAEDDAPGSTGDPDGVPPSKKEPAEDAAAKAAALAAVAGQPRVTTAPLPATSLPPGHHYLPNAQAPATAPVDVIVALEARVQAMETEKRVAAEAAERAELIAARQMSDETRKWLANPKTSLAEVKAACKVLPKAMAQNPAAAAMARPTLAEGQDSQARASVADPKLAREMGALMGMPATEDPTIHWGGADPSERTEPFDRVFPTSMSAAQAREVLKHNQEALAKSHEALRAVSRGGQGGAR